MTMKTPPTASTVYTTSKKNTTVTRTSIVTLIVLGLQHDLDPEIPHYPPLLRKDTHLEMVLYHHFAHHTSLLDLHQEEDQNKNLNLHLELVDLIFRLEYTHVCIHQQDIHHT